MKSLSKPLAESLRPQILDEFFGQSHLLRDRHPLKQAIDNKQLHSMILWGPSGTGKTTLARIICKQIDGHFAQLSAVLDGIKELRIVVENAKKFQNIGQQTVLFVDEIHRFNKAQQDAFLPHIESGLITLIGATTENPSFELNSALLSRLSVYVLEPLKADELAQILQRALTHENLTTLDKPTQDSVINASGGDARRLINIIEQIALAKLDTLDMDSVGQLLQEKIPVFDKGGDIFYQQLSAFHKSVRGSSPDGALYWMARMLVAGCDAKTIARRLLAIASEDIGNADPRALEITLNAWQVFERVGEKEGNRAIAQAAVYCAVAPKSNAVYKAFNQAMSVAKETGDLPVPKHLCNAPTGLMNDLGYGEGYRYAHNEQDAVAKGQTYFPEALGEQSYYAPTQRGLEIKISEKLKQLRGK
ncbi:replication-associated recombination protein A [bacterium endosymbiont of Bathymodiolus sp. 5 South]|jgi:putative ATPase|uniref:replication-associated recombination protein A n=1 Tax=bacterium endosymbiont of Bathymodiolus sp. 5 South TaxID=1181670 RepID=UPI0010B9539D|nr:replication-associated recombination protein A [bacterium endosymbiont of Bathymodiolus sp. 5 South]CAC9657231.1 Replication-associated recombination protein RarA [uncultured Gammaproteobacteria bacterium]SHN92593.1 FIG065221: Holliday junction DNA helicase [bacterium endosymbiont of Bathymodiolus sp. 5 South]SSC07980.1 FIG065221: Holliday junction DNA helicase [bacterium endosymbiont of Bathymodiolus sp. 5 South]VVH57359.1 FIG065221: Holliday junction DNA helicase [uncultured Gammaproteobac